jgi:hypothetical protein
MSGTGPGGGGKNVIPHKGCDVFQFTDTIIRGHIFLLSWIIDHFHPPITLHPRDQVYFSDMLAEQFAETAFMCST